MLLHRGGKVAIITALHLDRRSADAARCADPRKPGATKFVWPPIANSEMRINVVKRAKAWVASPLRPNRAARIRLPRNAETALRTPGRPAGLFHYRRRGKRCGILVPLA